MAVSEASWLVDRSALAHLDQEAVRRVLLPRIQAGRVAVTPSTELAVGFTVRSAGDYAKVRQQVLDLLRPVEVTAYATRRARTVQAELISRGQHREVSVTDLLVAAVAEAEQLTVLHDSGSFDRIADITGQPTERVGQQGAAG